MTSHYFANVLYIKPTVYGHKMFNFLLKSTHLRTNLTKNVQRCMPLAPLSLSPHSLSVSFFCDGMADEHLFTVFLYFVRPQKTITKTLRTKNLLQYSNWTGWTEMLIYQKSIAFLSFFIWPGNSFTSLALNGWSHAISVLKMRYRFG